MTPLIGEFAFTRLEKVVFGPGEVAVLGRELGLRGASRALVITGRTLGASRLLGKVTEAMDGRCAGVFAGIGQHNPAEGVRAMLAELARLGADAVVSFGGGAAIDAAKIAVASTLAGRDTTRDEGALDLGSAFRAVEAGGRGLVHIAVPTALSAGEFTPAGGATDEASRVKRATIDPRAQARVVIHDPELTLETPDWLWAATGVRALDHAVESAYSIRRQPFTDALAAEAIRLLVRHLPASMPADGSDAVAHRGYCQTASWFSLFGGFNTGLGLSHAVSHQLGPRWNVPHGVTSCITLAPSMRFMAKVAPERFGPIAEGLGLDFDEADPGPAARACADRIETFIAGLGVPNSLGKAGVDPAEAAAVAPAVLAGIERFGTIGRPMALEEVQDLMGQMA